MALKKQTRSSSKQKFWKIHLEHWSRSGLSQAAYCRQNNLKSRGFGYWKRKLEEKNLPIELVQLSPEQIYIGPPLKIHINSSYQIEVPDGFSRSTLKNVLMILRAL